MNQRARLSSLLTVERPEAGRVPVSEAAAQYASRPKLTMLDSSEREPIAIRTEAVLIMINA